MSSQPGCLPNPFFLAKGNPWSIIGRKDVKNDSKKGEGIDDLVPISDRRAAILEKSGLPKTLFFAGATTTERSGAKMSSRLCGSHVFGKARLGFGAYLGVGVGPSLVSKMLKFWCGDIKSMSEYTLLTSSARTSANRQI